jgi:hypothetical protein
MWSAKVCRSRECNKVGTNNTTSKMKTLKYCHDNRNKKEYLLPMNGEDAFW